VDNVRTLGVGAFVLLAQAACSTPAIEFTASAGLPTTLREPSPYSVVVDRQASEPELQRYIEMAEQLVPQPPALFEENCDFWKGQWWHREVDGTRVPYALTADAVSHLLGQAALYRVQSKAEASAGGAPMDTSTLVYEATVRRQGSQLVASLSLRWEQLCGNMCGLAFEKGRQVAFDSDNGSVLSVHGDGCTQATVY
jgi:hypothetical protein